MIVDLEAKEIVGLIKAFPPSSNDSPLIAMGMGAVTGFPNEKWVWHDTYFIGKGEKELWGIYLIVKQLNKKS